VLKDEMLWGEGLSQERALAIAEEIKVSYKIYNPEFEAYYKKVKQLIEDFWYT
jgi:hypothetical protein